MHIKPSTTRAFTLIDILVSVSIISFLSSIVMFNVSEGRTKAEDAQMKVESASVATAIELFKADNGGRTPISVREAEIQQNYGINTDTGEMYQEGTPEYEAVMNELVTGGYISEIPTSPDGESYAYGESTDGMQAVFAAQLQSESNISNNDQNSCDIIETTTETEACVEGEIPLIMPAPLFLECEYVAPKISFEDLPGPTSISQITVPARWDCKFPREFGISCGEQNPGTIPENCDIQDHTWEYADGVKQDLCPFNNDYKSYICMGSYENKPPCESVSVKEGYTCDNIDATKYEVCPIDQGGGQNLCDGETESDYCTCI